MHAAAVCEVRNTNKQQPTKKGKSIIIFFKKGEEKPEGEEAVPDQIGHGLETRSVEN